MLTVVLLTFATITVVLVALSASPRSARPAIPEHTAAPFVCPLPPRRTLRERIFDVVADQAIDLVDYDRKEDPELPRGMLEDLIDSGAISVDEIVDCFEAALRERLGIDDTADDAEPEAPPQA